MSNFYTKWDGYALSPSGNFAYVSQVFKKSLAGFVLRAVCIMLILLTGIGSEIYAENYPSTKSGNNLFFVPNPCTDVGSDRVNIENTPGIYSAYGFPSLLGASDLLVDYYMHNGSTDGYNTKIVKANGTVVNGPAINISPKTNDNSDAIIQKGLTDGNILVYWYSGSSGKGLTDVYFKIYNQSGGVVVEATKLNTSPGSLNRFVESAQLSNGNIIFTWATGGADYAMRRFKLDGTAVDAAQISLTALAGLSGISQYDYKIAPNANGKFMILINCYTAYYHGMIFNNDAATPVQVNGNNAFIAMNANPTGSGHVDKKPNIIALPNNKFLMVCQIQAGSGTATRSLALKVFNEDGSVAVAEKTIRQIYSWGSIYAPVVVADGFYIRYAYNDLNYGPGLGWVEYFEKYDFNCNLVSDNKSCLPHLTSVGDITPYADVNQKLGLLVNDKLTELSSDDEMDMWLIRNVTPCTAPIISSSPPNRSACAGSNATFTLNATGATAYQWQVNTGGGFINLTNGGVYSGTTTKTLTITGVTSEMNSYKYRGIAMNGSASCFANSNEASLTVSAISTDTYSQINVSCFGGSNGEATITPSGGVAPYTYSWAPSGGTGASATGLSAGSYTVTVTDNIGCVATRKFTITQPAALSATVDEQSNVSCYGGSNGSATVAVTGGTGSYSYSWAPLGGTAAKATGLAAGNYTVTVTDENLCSTTQSFTITQPLPLVVTAESQTNVSCNGGSNGSATVSVSGGSTSGVARGVATYSYSWAPSGGTAASATSLTAGTYVCTVTDINGCTASQSFTITQPTALTASADAQSNVSCNGGSNGSATVAVKGGTGDYTYSWAPFGGTSATATGLSAGKYTVTVTDENLCSTTQSFTITQPTALSASVDAQSNVSCYGGANGSATVAVIGGTGSYSYSWAPSGGTAAKATGLAAGSYMVTVTDENLCSTTQSFTITQPAPLVVTAESQSNVSCNGGSNGSATVSVSGGSTSGVARGVATYSYSWAPSGGTAASATGLTAGTYVCTVTDINGCTASQSFTITQPTALTASADAQSNVSCNGGSNGSATVAVKGGTGDYTYSWAPFGGTSATATGLSAGKYTVTATDENLCSTTQSFSITQPTALSASVDAQSNVSCYGGADGSATVSVTGGTPGYTYEWNTNPIQRTASASGLRAGMYKVYITDANGCTDTEKFTITEPEPLVFKGALLSGGQVEISYTATVKASGSNGSLKYELSEGRLPKGLSMSEAGVIQGIPQQGGTFNFKITATDKCTSKAADFSIFIAKGSQTISFNTLPLGAEYGDAAIVLNAAASSGLALSYVSSNTEVATINGRTLNIVGAGKAMITVNQPGNDDYQAASKNQELSVSKKMLTVKADVLAKVYGQTDPELTYQITSGKLVGEDAFSGTLSREEGEYVGSYKIQQGTLSLSENYNLVYLGNDLNISKRPITVTADLKSKTYGEADPALTYDITAGNLVNNDSFTGGLSRDAGEEVNAYQIRQGSLSLGENYDLVYVENILSIERRSVTVTAEAKSKTYGDTDPVLTYQIISGDLKGADVFSGSLKREDGENVGNYKITQGSLNLGANYDLVYQANNLSIEGRSVSITADAKSKIYGEADPALTYQITSGSLVGDDDFIGSLTREQGEDAGNYKIRQGSLKLDGNYNLIYLGADLGIKQRTLNVTADLKSKTYGQADPALTYQVTAGSLVGTDAFSGALSRVAGENAGTYKIRQESLTLGSNYNLVFYGNKMVIDKKALTITADDKEKFEGEANPILTANYSGFIDGEDHAVLIAQAALSTIATKSSPQGDYPIEVSNATALNYQISFVPGILTIKPGAPTSISLAAATLYENRPIGTAAGRFSSTSDSPTATFTYSLVEGEGDTDNGLFYVNGDELRSNASLNYENKASYKIRVRSTTQYNLSLERVFTISLTDVNEVPTLDAIADQIICYTSANQAIALGGISAGPDAGQSITLTASSTNSSLLSNLEVRNGKLHYRVADQQSGTAAITITVKDDGGTANGGVDQTTRTFLLTVNALPVISINSDQGAEVSKGQTVVLTATGGVEYSWNHGAILAGQNSASLTVRPMETTTYNLTVTSATGCQSVSSFTLTVKDDFQAIKPENFFTPNGDGVNDGWKVENIDVYPNHTLNIFDRAGRKVYEVKNYHNDWDGTIQGSPLQEGTYYYIFRFDDPNVAPKKGFITIVRQ